MSEKKLKQWLHGVNRSGISNISVFVLYSCMVLLVVLKHEPWADELQAWLIARDTSILELIQTMQYEGHFLPWYLLLRLFAANHAPVLSMNLVSCFLSIVAAGILIFKSPFSLIEKILFLISGGMLFWYPAVARCYALIPPILFLLAHYHGKRLEHPVIYGVLIGFLTNTHAYMEAFCGMLFLYLFLDWKKETNCKKRKALLISMGCAFTGAMLAFIQVMPSLFVAESVGSKRFWPHTMNFWEKLYTGLFDFGTCTLEYARTWKGFPVYPIMILVIFVTLVYFLYYFRKGIIIVLFGGFALLFAFFNWHLLPNSQFVNLEKEIGVCLFLPLFFIFTIILFSIHRKYAFLLMVSFVWQWLFAAFIFYFLPQRALLMMQIALFCTWCLKEEKTQESSCKDDDNTMSSRICKGKRKYDALQKCFILYMLFALGPSLSFFINDIQNEFSGEKTMGDWITRNIPKGSTILIPFYGITSAVVSAYTPNHKIWCVESDSEITYCPLTRKKTPRFKKFHNSDNWQDLMSELPKPHYFLCDARFFNSFPLNKIDFKIGEDHFYEAKRTEMIPFENSGGEQFWFFTDDSKLSDELSKL